MESFWHWWNGLSQGVRDGIVSTVVGGAGLGMAAAIFKLSGRSLKAVLRRLVGASPVAPPQSQLHEVVVRVETPQAPPRNEESKPDALPAARVANNLPRPPHVGFVARRDKEHREIVKRLKEELAPRKNQLVALWGDGGVGKTTIAAELARAMIEAFAMRIVWASADGHPDFALSTLLDEVTTQLGEPEMRKLAPEPKMEAVDELIAKSATPLLVVLDNFETISPAEQKKCAKWLDNQARCPVLITTRTRVDGARNVPIDVMSPSEANKFLDGVIAQAQNSGAIEQLDRNRVIESAEANPLVMQWVIAQIDLAQRPSDVLDDLARGEGDAVQRVFDRSFNLPQLGDDGRDTLLALSLFVPDASHRALAEVAGFGDDVRRLTEAVMSLAALCLVETTSAGERLAVKGLKRNLARARMSKHERADRFRQRFVAYFCGYGEAHRQPSPEDYTALGAEKENLLGSMDIAVQLQDGKSFMRIRESLEHYLYKSGYWAEAVRSGERAVELAGAEGDDRRAAKFARNVAKTHRRLGHYEDASRLYEQVILLLKQSDTPDLDETLDSLATVKQGQRDYEKARELYKESLEIKRKRDDEKGIAITVQALGRLAQAEGKLEEARRLYNESLEINRTLGDRGGIAIVLQALGGLAQEERDFDQALRLYNESLEINKELEEPGKGGEGTAVTLRALGGLAQQQRLFDKARRLYDESLEINRRLINQLGIAIVLHCLGTLAKDEGNPGKARELFHESLQIKRRLGDLNGIAITSQALQELEKDHGQDGEATR